VLQSPDTPVTKESLNQPKKVESSLSMQKSTNNTSGELSYSQQLKQDAMLWAEFLYSEYKREKSSFEEKIITKKPTYHDKTSK